MFKATLWALCWTPDKIRYDWLSTDRLISVRLGTDRLRNIGLETHVSEAKITYIHAETLVEAF